MPDPVETPRRRLTSAVAPAVAVAALAAAGAIALVSVNGANRQAVAPRDCILENADAIGGPIELVDANGARVTQADFAGEPAVIYFGFTHCPDICPSSMYAVAEALAQPDGYDVQPVLISLDPARDTPERLREYVHTNGFPEGLVGLTGSEAQVEAAASAFQVYHSKVALPGGDPAAYTVDHSSLLYVVDAQWRTVAALQTMRRETPADPQSPMIPAAPADIAACIAAGLERAAAS